MAPEHRATRRAKPAPPELDAGVRSLLGLIGLALIVLGTSFWVSPPSHKAFAPSATTKGAIGDVETPSDTFSGVLVGIGAVFILVAANGAKLASVKFGDAEVDWAGVETKAKAAAEKAKKKAELRGYSIEKQVEASASAFTRTYERAAQMVDAHGLDPEAIADEAVESVRAEDS
jgi:hypothetical protein